MSISSRFRAAIRPRGLRPVLPTVPAQTASYWAQNWNNLVLPSASESTVLGLAGAWKALGLICNGVASMAPPRLVASDGFTELEAPPIVTRPNASLGVYDFFHQAVASCVMRGNFIGVLADFDVDGWPRQVVPVHVDNVVCRVDDGYLVYQIGDLVLSADEVIHVRGFTQIGNPWGIGVVENFRRSLGQQLNQQATVAAVHGVRAVPSVVVKVNRPEVSPEQATSVKSQFLASQADGSGVSVLSEQFDVMPLSWSPEAAEFLASRQFSIAELALMFGLDPTDMNASIGGQGLLYANVTDREAARVIDVYGPWIARFEDAFSDVVPGSNLVRFRRDFYKHANRKALLEEQAIGLASGVLSIDDCRAELNLSPIGAKP